MRPICSHSSMCADRPSTTLTVACGNCWRKAATSGAVITKVDADSDAAEKGLQAGDVVLKIGNRTVRTPADFQSGVTDAKKGGRSSVLLLVARTQGGTGFVAIDIEKS